MSEANELLEMVVEHLCEHQAEEVAELPDDEIRRRAAVGVARAQAFGFQKSSTIAAFVSLLFVAGPHFDEQRNIRKALQDDSLPPDTRMTKLFAVTSEKDWDEAAALSQSWD